MTRVEFLDSAMCALKGLINGVSKERNIRIQFFITAVLVLISLLSNVQRTSLIIIILICFFGIILELLNTSFERLVDVIYPDYNKEVKKFKDEVAGMVALTFIIVVIISAIILYNPILNLLISISKNSLILWLIAINIGVISLIILISYLKSNQKKSLHQQ